MTYQEQFLNNRYAQIATQIGHNRRFVASEMHALSHHLELADRERHALKGKFMSDDHLRQVAVNFIP